MIAPMRILFVSDDYPPYAKGGSALSTSLLANWLLENGHTVSVACSKFAEKPWTENGVSVCPIIIKPSVTPKNFLSAICYAFAIIIFEFISVMRVVTFIRKFKPDIVNVVPPTYRFIPIVLAIRMFLNYPVVVDCRDYSLICPAHLNAAYFDGTKDFDEAAQTHHGYRCIGYTSANNFSLLSIRPFALYEACVFNLYKSSLRFLVNHWGGITLVGVSKYVQQQLILNGFEAEKTTSIYNIARSPERALFHAEPKTPTFAYGGRIEKDKGIWDVIAAVEILKKLEKQPFTVKIAGIGAESDNLQSYIKEHDLAGVTLLGKIKPEAVLALYEESLAIIAPSRIPEPFGRFVLDAISVGKPIITTRTGGTPEGVREGKTGFLVDVGNAEQLAAAMRCFIEHPDQSRAMREAIIEQQKYYKPDLIGQKRLELYGNLIKKFSAKNAQS